MLYLDDLEGDSSSINTCGKIVFGGYVACVYTLMYYI